MAVGDPASTPNPFAIDLDRRRRRGTRSIWSAAKWLLAVAAVFAAVVVIGSESRRWLLGRLTDDFAELDADEKRRRLAQISEFDEPALPHLVAALTERDVAVARTAYEALRRLQNEWTTLDRVEMLRRHRVLVDEIDSVAIQVPDDRTGWLSGLLQQTMLETVSQADSESRQLHRRSADVMGRLALAERPGPSVLSGPPAETSAASRNDPEGSRAPVRISARAQPLPVEDGDGEWTDWPPESTSSRPPVPNGPGGYAGPATGGATVRDAGNRTSDEADGGREADAGKKLPAEPSPSIYQSSVRLQAVPRARQMELRPIGEPRATSFRDAPQGEAKDGGPAAEADLVRPANQLVDSPLQTLDDRSVMHWLGSGQPSLRDQATEELRRRGYGDEALSLASQIAAENPRTRLAAVEALTRSRRLDPRPWLLMMLDDPNRDVKLRVISALATLGDPAVDQRLRTRLAEEQDPAVVAGIRRVLNLR